MPLSKGHGIKPYKFIQGRLGGSVDNPLPYNCCHPSLIGSVCMWKGMVVIRFDQFYFSPKIDKKGGGREALRIQL